MWYNLERSEATSIIHIIACVFSVWDSFDVYPRFPVPLIEFFIRYALYFVRPQRDSEAEPSCRLTGRDYHNLPVYPFGDRAKSESIKGYAMGYSR